MENFVRHVKDAFDNHVGSISIIDFVVPVVQEHSNQITVHSECNPRANEYIRDLVYQEDRFEIYLIRWAPGSKSKIHDHSEQGCVMKLLKGTLAETRFHPKSLEAVGSVIHTIHTEASFIHNSIAVHSVGNQSTDSHALSMHLYAPPKHVAQTFEK